MINHVINCQNFSRKISTEVDRPRKRYKEND